MIVLKIAHAADKMGLSRRQFFNKITEYGIRNIYKITTIWNNLYDLDK